MSNATDTFEATKAALEAQYGLAFEKVKIYASCANAVLVWDFLVTFQDEFNHVWRSRWAFLFFATWPLWTHCTDRLLYIGIQMVVHQGPLPAQSLLGSHLSGALDLEVRFDLHSFGGSGDTAKRIVKNHPHAFFSLSTTINARLPPRKLHTLISSVPPNRLLVESDWNSSIGSDEKLWAILGVLCKVRGWDVGECVDRMERNWRVFVGDEVEEVKRKRNGRGKKKKEPFEIHNGDGSGERSGSNGNGSNGGFDL